MSSLPSFGYSALAPWKRISVKQFHLQNISRVSGERHMPQLLLYNAALASLFSSVWFHFAFINWEAGIVVFPLTIVVPHSASSATQVWQQTKNNFCTLQMDYSADVTQWEVWSRVVVLVVVGKKTTHLTTTSFSWTLSL